MIAFCSYFQVYLLSPENFKCFSFVLCLLTSIFKYLQLQFFCLCILWILTVVCVFEFCLGKLWDHEEGDFLQREFAFVSVRSLRGSISVWQGHFKLNCQLEIFKISFFETYQAIYVLGINPINAVCHYQFSIEIWILLPLLIIEVPHMNISLKGFWREGGQFISGLSFPWGCCPLRSQFYGRIPIRVPTLRNPKRLWKQTHIELIWQIFSGWKPASMLSFLLWVFAFI